MNIELVLSMFEIKKYHSGIVIAEVEILDIENNDQYKAVKIVMNQSCYFLTLISQVESPQIDWSGVLDNFTENCSKLTSIYKNTNINEFLLARTIASKYRPDYVSKKKSKDDGGVRIRTMDILDTVLEEGTKSQSWILLFDSDAELSKFVNSIVHSFQNLLQTRLCQIENASIFTGMKFSDISEILDDNSKLRHISDDDFKGLKVVYFSFLNPTKLKDMLLMIKLKVHWLPVKLNSFQRLQESGNLVLSRDLLLEWGLFSDLESYILFRLEGKTANFYVKDHSEGYTMAIPRDQFLVARFDQELEDIGGVVVDDEIQINQKTFYTVEFSHIPLRNLGRLKSRLYGKTIQEFVYEVVNSRIKTKDEIKLWVSQKHVKITAMS